MPWDSKNTPLALYAEKLQAPGVGGMWPTLTFGRFISRPSEAIAAYVFVQYFQYFIFYWSVYAVKMAARMSTPHFGRGSVGRGSGGRLPC